jgi:hypothetical protein
MLAPMYRPYPNRERALRQLLRRQAVRDLQPGTYRLTRSAGAGSRP